MENSEVLLRGGRFDTGAPAGLLTFDIADVASSTYMTIGFRLYQCCIVVVDIMVRFLMGFGRFLLSTMIIHMLLRRIGFSWLVVGITIMELLLVFWHSVSVLLILIQILTSDLVLWRGGSHHIASNASAGILTFRVAEGVSADVDTRIYPKVLRRGGASDNGAPDGFWTFNIWPTASHNDALSRILMQILYQVGSWWGLDLWNFCWAFGV